MPKKKFKFKTDNTLPAYGETDYDKRIVKINRKRHKSSRVKRISKKPDGTEHLGKTLLHETLHIDHPSATEATVRKMEKQFDKMSPRQKKKLYSKLK